MVPRLRTERRMAAPTRLSDREANRIGEAARRRAGSCLARAALDTMRDADDHVAETMTELSSRRPSIDRGEHADRPVAGRAPDHLHRVTTRTIQSRYHMLKRTRDVHPANRSRNSQKA